MPLPINRILVFGGTGFVGQAVMKAGLSRGYEMIGFSRKGAPKVMMHGLDKHPLYEQKAKWVSADIENPVDEWTQLISREAAVVSCVGGFGTNEQMKRLNGDANANLVLTAKEKGALRCVYVSAYEVEKEIPISIMPGYFEGKRIAEKAVDEHFPSVDGVILQPGFVYGSRVTDGKLVIPLGWVGWPMEALFNLPVLNQLRKLPMLGKLAFSPPVSVDDVGLAAVRGAEGLLTEQYVSDEVSLNDDNEHNPAFVVHHHAIKLEIPAIRQAARDEERDMAQEKLTGIRPGFAAQ